MINRVHESLGWWFKPTNIRDSEDVEIPTISEINDLWTIETVDFKHIIIYSDNNSFDWTPTSYHSDTFPNVVSLNVF